ASCGIGPAALVPRMVEGDLDADVRHARHVAHSSLHLVWQHLRGGTAGGRERHAHGHGPGRADLDAIDQPELVDVHWDLRIVDLAEGFDNALLDLRTIDGRHRRATPSLPARPGPGAQRAADGTAAWRT